MDMDGSLQEKLGHEKKALSKAPINGCGWE